MGRVSRTVGRISNGKNRRKAKREEGKERMSKRKNVNERQRS